MTNPVPHSIDDPKLIDLAVLGLQDAFSSGLSWLTTAYGVAERREEFSGNQKVIIPRIFAPSVGMDHRYVSMLPDEHLGNYCWFDVQDSEKVKRYPGQPSIHTAKLGVIFWFNFETVFPDAPKTNTTRNLEDQVLTILENTPNTVKSINDDMEIIRKGPNIYKGYTLDEAVNQKLSRPYGAFRINFEIKYDQYSCAQAALLDQMIRIWATPEADGYETPQEELYT